MLRTTLKTPEGPVTGCLFHALGRNDHVCFVPQELVNKWDEHDYTENQWAAFNCSVQDEPVGAHLIPDMKRPVKDPPNQILERMHAQAATFQTAPKH